MSLGRVNEWRGNRGFQPTEWAGFARPPPLASSQSPPARTGATRAAFSTIGSIFCERGVELGGAPSHGHGADFGPLRSAVLRRLDFH
jgi:hypothetical protein